LPKVLGVGSFEGRKETENSAFAFERETGKRPKNQISPKGHISEIKQKPTKIDLFLKLPTSLPSP
jgi:hypothetical protein